MKEQNLPKHIAIIMDGNGRWAKKKGNLRSYGHDHGMTSVIQVVEHARELGLDYLTLYAFSTENWKRPKKEVDFIMKLLVKYIRSEIDKLADNGVRLNILGEYKGLNPESVKAIEYALEKTGYNKDMVLNIALNYGGRNEILRACKLIGQLCYENKLDPEDIDEALFASYLYTAGQADPDLIIRTGSEQRLSNFLTYQGVYSELYFTDVLWPDFRADDLDEAISNYLTRQRRYGGLNE